MAELPVRTGFAPPVQKNFDALKDRTTEAEDAATALATRVTTLEAGGGAFIAPTLAGTWVNAGGAGQTSGYVKDSIGFAHLQGQVKSGSGTIFTLPSGYRPSATVGFAVVGDSALAYVTITSAGVVALAVGAATVFLTLDGINFKAA